MHAEGRPQRTPTRSPGSSPWSRRTSRSWSSTRSWASCRGSSQDGLYGIDQISEIVVSLRNFARLDRSKVANFNLNEGLQSTLRSRATR